MASIGAEHFENSGEKQHVSEQRGTESGTLPADFTPNRPAMDADLADVIAAWPTLPATIRAGILAMVKGASG